MEDFDTNNIVPISVNLLEGQIDLILRSLELYAFNLHHTWSVRVDDDLEELRNALIFYTYNTLINSKKSSNYVVAYDFSKEFRLKRDRKKYLQFKNAKKIA